MKISDWSVSTKRALAGTILMAGLSTAADFIWAQWSVRHTVVHGLLHGGILFVFLGLFLASCSRVDRRWVKGVVGGLSVGVLAAASFYFLALLIQFTALWVAWVLLWILLAALCSYLNLFPRSQVVVRALASAVASGLAFYTISGIWTNPSPGGPDYLTHFLSWFVAYLPALLPLVMARRPDQDSVGGRTE